MRLKLLAAAAALAVTIPVTAQNDPTPRVHGPVRADISPPLREIIANQPQSPGREINKPIEIANQFLPEILRSAPVATAARNPTVAMGVNSSQAPTAGLSFEGYSNADNVTLVGGQVAPPDTNGDVGQNFYIQYINLGWSVFDKADGSVAAGPFIGNTFWAGFGGACESGNAGDPIVLYDEIADRWLFSQFANPVSAAGSQCFAVSQTNDPLGPYNRYEYAIPGIDYPKIGVFSDGASNSGYYLTTNNFAAGFSGTSMIAADRDAMLAGDPTATFIEFNTTAADPFFSIQPGHLEGTDLPPAGTCNPFIMAFDDEIWAGTSVPTDGYQLWEFCPDFTTPANSTLTGPTLIGSADEWDQELCGFAECVAQPGTAQLLDTLSQFTMYRAAMRFNPLSAPGSLRLVISNTVDLGGDQAGVRWAELDITAGATATIADEGTYAPADTENRWLPSIAMDISGNIAMAYSLGSAATAPSIYFTGRETTDAPGTMQTEAVCVDGTGVQTGIERWVDYASMSVDPADDCTFWFTSEYYETTSNRGWTTRVCSFGFPNCGIDRVILTPTSDNLTQSVCVGDPIDPITFDVANNTGGVDPINLAFSNLPADFTGAFTVNPVTPPGASQADVTVGAAVTAGIYDFDVVGSGAGLEDGMFSISLDVASEGPTETSTLLTPQDGLLDSTALPTFSWTPVAGAFDYELVVTEVGSSTVVISEIIDGTDFTAAAPLAASEEHSWTVTARNACGNGAVSAASTFTVVGAAPDATVLLVDDDDNTPNVVGFFADSMQNLVIPFDVFDTGNSDTTEPDAVTMANYDAVVWFTGDNFGGATGPGAASETEIATYLDGGGCMLMSSQDWTFAKAGGFGTPAPTTLMTDYFGLETFGQDENHTEATGLDVFAGLGPYTLDFSISGASNFSDELEPNANGVSSFAGNMGDNSQSAGVASSNGTFNTAWTGFPIPALPTQGDIDDVLSAFVVDVCGVVAESGGLSGTVTITGTAIPVPGVTVTADRAGVPVTTVSGADGTYSFDALASGFYIVSAEGTNVVVGDPDVNVEIVAANVTSLDIEVDASVLQYDSATVVETVEQDGTANNPLLVENLGTLPLDYAIEIGNYAEPDMPLNPVLRSGDSNQVGRRSSGGLTAMLEAPESMRKPYAPGDNFLSAPFGPGSPLGITSAPNGTVWVASVSAGGQTVRYNSLLAEEATFANPIAGQATGLAYDSVNGTLWWLDLASLTLVEGSPMDGTATGNTIVLDLPAGTVATGVEYDEATDLFYLLDIVNDDIFAMDRTGLVATGYPVPQTDFDDGSGVFGNGLDVIDGRLDVLIGLSGDGQTTRSVVTSLFGVNLGGETPFDQIPDTFINDAVRSRIDSGIMYVVGNATSAIYAIEPISLTEASQWASVDQEMGTIPPGGSVTLDLLYDATGLPLGSYAAELAVAGNFINVEPAKALGLNVGAQVGYDFAITGYVGADAGAQCLGAGGTDPVPANPGDTITYCVEFTNTGAVDIANPVITVAPLGVDQSSMLLIDGSLPIAAGASATYTFTFAGPDPLPATITADAEVTPVDGDGNAIAGIGDTTASDDVVIAPAGEIPTADDQSVTVLVDTPTAITLTGTDPAMGALTFTVGTPPANGMLSGTAPDLTYTPNAGYEGPDSFTFTVNNGSVDSAEATVTITVITNPVIFSDGFESPPAP